MFQRIGLDPCGETPASVTTKLTAEDAEVRRGKPKEADKQTLSLLCEPLRPLRFFISNLRRTRIKPNIDILALR